MIAFDLNFNMSEILHVSNASHSEKMLAHGQVIWRAVGPIICGSENKKQNGAKHDRANDFMLRSGPSMRALRWTLYVLTGDPKILYAPNGTQADLVIAKVSQMSLHANCIQITLDFVTNISFLSYAGLVKNALLTFLFLSHLFCLYSIRC